MRDLTKPMAADLSESSRSFSRTVSERISRTTQSAADEKSFEALRDRAWKYGGLGKGQTRRKAW